jgi:predicted DNA-binding antitoxin AbrB/MazE fold protein
MKLKTVSLKEGHKLKVFENRVLRKIFGPKGEDITGVTRKLHKEELYNLFPSPKNIRVMKSGGG